MKGKRARAVEMLVSGEFKLYEIAEELKISEKTLYNWRCEEEFDAEYRRRMNIKIGRIAGKALKTQEELLESRSDMVKHLAAKDILDRAGYTPDSNINIHGDAAVQIIDDIPNDTKIKEEN